MKDLSGTDLIKDLQYFWTDLGYLCSKLYIDLNKRMIWVAAHKWILANISNILSPQRVIKSKCPSEMSVEKYPGNELLLSHIETNTMILLILRHIPLLPNYHDMYQKSIPSGYHPTQTFLGSKTGHTINVSNL